MTFKRVRRCTPELMWMIMAVLAMPSLATGDHFPDELDVAELVGQQPDINFGKTVANLGDVNGNGFDDIAVAAAYDNNGAGTVFIYLGGKEFFDTEPDFILQGESADDQFGISIAGDMDLNGSGHADIAIGARFSDQGAENAGAVFIYFGGPEISTEPSLILVGENADDWFGQSVSSAGDVNGNGFDDLIVGAPFNDDLGNASGKAYLFYGGEAMNDQPNLELHGDPVNHAHFGWSVAGGGDVNGSGFADLIIGARLHGTGPAHGTGRAYVFFGGEEMNQSPDLIIDGEFPNGWFGESVAIAGDANGNGYDDVLVGAHFASTNGSGSGRGYVFFGGPAMGDSPDITFDGPEADAQLGNDVAGLGDVSDNGHDDVAFGAHFANTTAGANSGQAFILFGGPKMQSNYADLALAGEAADDQFGTSVSAGGDLATGNRSFLVGAHHNNEGGNGAGKAYVIRKDMEPIPGDLTGDGSVGVADLLVLLSLWGNCDDPNDCPADLNGDGTVDVSDLLILLSKWG